MTTPDGFSYRPRVDAAGCQQHNTRRLTGLDGLSERPRTGPTGCGAGEAHRSTAPDDLSDRLRDIYDRLLAAYGPRGWWPGAESPFEVVVGAILTQNTAWANVERALPRLREAGALSVEGMRAIPEPELAQLLRPAGYFNTKARKLKAFVAMLDADHGGDLARLLAQPAAELRERLLATWGIGPETADCIVLYTAGKPSFMVDAYTVRIFTRLGITPARDRYEDWRRLFMEALPPDVPMYNEYHALIVTHGHRTCRPAPRCEGCVLREGCTWPSPPTPLPIMGEGLGVQTGYRGNSSDRAQRSEVG